jgi:hypothetical protein
VSGRRVGLIRCGLRREVLESSAFRTAAHATSERTKVIRIGSMELAMQDWQDNHHGRD